MIRRHSDKPGGRAIVSPAPNAQPSPELFFSTLNAYHHTEAMKAAIELELFTAVAEGNQTTETIARRCEASERGIRILCDVLVVMGFLTKESNRYGLTSDSAVFLDRRSPAYLGGAIGFLLSPMTTERWKDLTAAVRKGGAPEFDSSTVAPEHPVWVEFARCMAPMMAMPAQLLAKYLEPSENHASKVLDLAAGHGLYGIAFARHNPNCEVWAVDWSNVLQVARENAAIAGVKDRYHTLPGSAFEVDYGSGYDLVLMPNFLSHFDPPTCEALLRKVHASLQPDGRAVILQMIPNEDRVSPPRPAEFALIMLASTPNGDAYTFPEYQHMLRNAGFRSSEKHALMPDFLTVVVGHK
jgi:2-polyprenyl-3-methyl-5-hydroxy-6-metoxy-1,4-benzoquinol methylase